MVRLEFNTVAAHACSKHCDKVVRKKMLLPKGLLELMKENSTVRT